MPEIASARRYSQWEMILLSLYRVADGGTGQVPYEELVLQAWRDFPEAFSLRNYPQYPDASDVHKRLSDPLKRDGLVLFLGNKTFRLTDKGVEAAQRLLAERDPRQPGPKTGTIRLSRTETIFIDHAFKTRAFSTWMSGERNLLIDYDAKQFFQFSTGTSLERRTQKVAFAREAIKKADHIGMAGADQLDLLADYLVQQFFQLLEEK